MKIQGQSYESVVDCVLFSNQKSYPNLHISTHRIDMSGIIKISHFQEKVKIIYNSPDQSYDQSNHPDHEPY